MLAERLLPVGEQRGAGERGGSDVHGGAAVGAGGEEDMPYSLRQARASVISPGGFAEVRVRIQTARVASASSCEGAEMHALRQDAWSAHRPSTMHK